MVTIGAALDNEASRQVEPYTNCATFSSVKDVSPISYGNVRKEK